MSFISDLSRLGIGFTAYGPYICIFQSCLQGHKTFLFEAAGCNSTYVVTVAHLGNALLVRGFSPAPNLPVLGGFSGEWLHQCQQKPRDGKAHHYVGSCWRALDVLKYSVKQLKDRSILGFANISTWIQNCKKLLRADVFNWSCLKQQLLYWADVALLSVTVRLCFSYLKRFSLPKT